MIISVVEDETIAKLAAVLEDIDSVHAESRAGFMISISIEEVFNFRH